MTDRDRLAAAFDILRNRGWFAPIQWSAKMCCSECGWREVESHPSVWWTSDADNMAFLCVGQEVPLTADVKTALLASDDPSSWARTHRSEITQASLVVKTGDPAYQTLRGDLALNWSWPGAPEEEGAKEAAQEVVDVLISCGLDATMPTSRYECITVHPQPGNMDINAFMDEDEEVVTIVIGADIVTVPRWDGLRLFHALGSMFVEAAATAGCGELDNGQSGETVRMDAGDD